MHICISNPTIIGSDNGLSPGRRQAIIWTIAGILLIGPLGTNFSEILIEIHTFSLKKMHLKMSSGKWPPFSLGLNVLMIWWHSNTFLSLWWHSNIFFSLWTWSWDFVFYVTQNEFIWSCFPWIISWCFRYPDTTVCSVWFVNYCKISNISCTKSQNFSNFRLLLQLSLPNPLKPSVKLRMKMQLEQHRQAMLQLHLSDQQFYCILRCGLY